MTKLGEGLKRPMTYKIVDYADVENLIYYEEDATPFMDAQAAEIERLTGENQRLGLCEVCTNDGKTPNCICGRIGTGLAEKNGLRDKCFELLKQLEAAEASNASLVERVNEAKRLFMDLVKSREFLLYIDPESPYGKRVGDWLADYAAMEKGAPAEEKA